MTDVTTIDIDPNNGDVYFTDSINPFIYRVTEEQVNTNTSAPETIPLAPEVNYAKNTRTNNPLESTASGSRPASRSLSSTA